MSEKVTKHKLTDVEKYIRAMHKAKANIAVVGWACSGTSTGKTTKETATISNVPIQGIYGNPILEVPGGGSAMDKLNGVNNK